MKKETHVDVVILAGGRGQRLGALTHQRNKGTLKLHGTPILKEILDQWISVPGIGRVWVVTGYRSGDVQFLLSDQYSGELAGGRIISVNGPINTVGTLQRFLCVLREGAGNAGAMVTGIDAIFSQVDIDDFVAYSGTSHAPIMLCCSKDIRIAPTHPAVRLYRDRVIEYRIGAVQRTNPLIGRWYRDTGLRYFSQAACTHMIRDDEKTSYLGEYLTSQLAAKVQIRGRRLRRRWIHLASPQDFTNSVPI